MGSSWREAFRRGSIEDLARRKGVLWFRVKACFRRGWGGWILMMGCYVFRLVGVLATVGLSRGPLFAVTLFSNCFEFKLSRLSPSLVYADGRTVGEIHRQRAVESMFLACNMFFLFVPVFAFVAWATGRECSLRKNGQLSGWGGFNATHGMFRALLLLLHICMCVLSLVRVGIIST